jgi:hypothetical protein
VERPWDTLFVIWAGANDYLSKEPFTGDIRTLLDTPRGEAGYERIVDEAVHAIADVGADFRRIPRAQVAAFDQRAPQIRQPHHQEPSGACGVQTPDIRRDIHRVRLAGGTPRLG